MAQEQIPVVSGSGITLQTAFQRINNNFTELYAKRPALAAPLTLFVRTTGNDTTGDGFSAGTAFATIQKAVDLAASLDTVTHLITIDVGPGTFSTRVILRDPIGIGNVLINGAGAASTIIAVASNHAILADRSLRYTLQNLRISNTVSGSAVFAYRKSLVNIGVGVEFGPSVSAHVFCADATVSLNNAYSVAGNAIAHWWTENGGLITCGGQAITLVGTPAFTIFANATFNSTMRVNANTFIGSATGQRYVVSEGSVIATGGGGANYLPGNVAGSVVSGVYA